MLHCKAMHDVFRRGAHRASVVFGSPLSFAAAVFLVIAWAVGGFIFGFTDSWQLYINTGTTILTFLMVFLIQNTQNRDSHAVHLKLDELIKASRPARDKLIDIEDMDDAELEKYEEEFRKLRERREVHRHLANHPAAHPTAGHNHVSHT